MDIVIKNAHIINEDKSFVSDLRIRAGRIEQIATSITPKAGDHVIDASGLTLLPGMIDDQVHFREPGMTHKAEISTESAAAVAGGITSFMDMPNTVPNALTSEILEDKFVTAHNKSHANYSFYLGAANNNLEDIKRLDPKSACGIKVFMGASTGNMLVDDPKTLEGIFRDAPTLIATHCEDTPMIKDNELAAREKYGEDVPMFEHANIRSEAACIASSTMAYELAKTHGTRLHILHISTAKETGLFQSGPVADKRITGEACVHFLHFNSDDYASKGALIKCNPSIKTPADQRGIIEALLDDRLDLIGTDHAPHSWEEKQNPYFSAPSGLPLVQYALLAILEKYHQGLFTLPFIVRKTSHAVADCFDIHERGYIREGYWADLVLVDLNKKTRATKSEVLSKCGWTPFEGYEFNSSIHTTIVSGEIAYENGRVVPIIRGHRLEFDR